MLNGDMLEAFCDGHFLFHVPSLYRAVPTFFNNSGIGVSHVDGCLVPSASLGSCSGCASLTMVGDWILVFEWKDRRELRPVAASFLLQPGYGDMSVERPRRNKLTMLSCVLHGTGRAAFSNDLSQWDFVMHPVRQMHLDIGDVDEFWKELSGGFVRVA